MKKKHVLLLSFFILIFAVGGAVLASHNQNEKPNEDAPSGTEPAASQEEMTESTVDPQINEIWGTDERGLPGVTLDVQHVKGRLAEKVEIEEPLLFFQWEEYQTWIEKTSAARGEGADLLKGCDESYFKNNVLLIYQRYIATDKSPAYTSFMTVTDYKYAWIAFHDEAASDSEGNCYSYRVDIPREYLKDQYILKVGKVKFPLAAAMQENTIELESDVTAGYISFDTPVPEGCTLFTDSAQYAEWLGRWRGAISYPVPVPDGSVRLDIAFMDELESFAETDFESNVLLMCSGNFLFQFYHMEFSAAYQKNGSSAKLILADTAFSYWDDSFEGVSHLTLVKIPREYLKEINELEITTLTETGLCKSSVRIPDSI